MILRRLRVLCFWRPRLFANEDNGQTVRDAHAYLGSATMFTLFAHLATGVISWGYLFKSHFSR